MFESMYELPTCATKGVTMAPTLAMPLHVPRPSALVVVGYTCVTTEHTHTVGDTGRHYGHI